MCFCALGGACNAKHWSASLILVSAENAVQNSQIARFQATWTVPSWTLMANTNHPAPSIHFKELVPTPKCEETLRLRTQISRAKPEIVMYSIGPCLTELSLIAFSRASATPRPIVVVVRYIKPPFISHRTRWSTHHPVKNS